MPNHKANTHGHGDGHVIRSFRISVDTEQRLKALAAAEHRTFSQEIRRLIDQRLAEGEQEPEAA